ncbi:ABC transporter substrate-binding protein, partial [Bacillus sp. SIMBA_005]|uniref:ABC transporter substrate-binding protein n=1 Tax=Bacillus sp. SIMBA_005 TaxID=3085754 RepID=UPI0039796211
NNNPWVGDSSAQRLGYANALFEPLAITNSVDPTADPVPWLASEFEWSEDYTSVAITARDGVTWSDGESFTADDIAFTFQLIKDNPAFDT